MVSSLCCSFAAPICSLNVLVRVGYRYRQAPRQEGQQDRPQKRRSVLAFARQGVHELCRRIECTLTE